MGRRRHKRKNSHVVIVTSDAVDSSTKQFRVKFWVAETLGLLLCVLIGTAIGFFIFAQDVSDVPEEEANIEPEQNYEDVIAELEDENAQLKSQVAELTGTVQILSDTVTQKAESESSLLEQLERQFTPTEFPLTGSATFESAPEGDLMCVFSATEGAMVVATASGTVSAVNDDAEYGHNVWVDHGNGYVTIYRNQGKVKVKQGETVRQGSTLILIDENNSSLGYQMMKDGVYIDPMDMLVISG